LKWTTKLKTGLTISFLFKTQLRARLSTTREESDEDLNTKDEEGETQAEIQANPVKDAETIDEIINGKDSEPEGKEKETELGQGDDKEGGEDDDDLIDTKDAETAADVIDVKDGESDSKDVGGEGDVLNLFKGLGAAAGGGLSIPKAEDYMYRLDFNAPTPTGVDITNEDYLAKLEAYTPEQELDDIIKRNSGGMFT